MDKYEKLAEEIVKKVTEKKGPIEISAEVALKIINYLYGMSRIKTITESEYGGAELFK